MIPQYATDKTSALQEDMLSRGAAAPLLPKTECNRAVQEPAVPLDKVYA